MSPRLISEDALDEIEQNDDWRARFALPEQDPEDLAGKVSVQLRISTRFRALLDAALEADGGGPMTTWIAALIAERISETLDIPLSEIPEYSRPKVLRFQH